MFSSLYLLNLFFDLFYIVCLSFVGVISDLVLLGCVLVFSQRRYLYTMPLRDPMPESEISLLSMAFPYQMTPIPTECPETFEREATIDEATEAELEAQLAQGAHTRDFPRI